MMAKNSEFEEEMRKSDTAAYRAGLADEPGTESTAAFMKRTGTKANRPKATVGGPRIVTKEELYIAKKYQESVINEEKYYFNLSYNGKENDFSLTKFNTNFEFEEIEREMERENQERIELEKQEEEMLQEEEEKMLELEEQNFFEEDYEYYDYLDRKYMEHIEGVN